MKNIILSTATLRLFSSYYSPLIIMAIQNAYKTVGIFIRVANKLSCHFMCLVMISILFAITPSFVWSQNYIYKKTLTGEITVFKSTELGAPIGDVVGTFKRNIVGDLIYTSISQEPELIEAKNPFTRRIHYTPHNSYYTPLADIANAFNAAISFYGTSSNSRPKPKATANLQGGITKRAMLLKAETENSFRALIDFYDKCANKPVQVSDGWHIVHQVIPMDNQSFPDYFANKRISVCLAYTKNSSIKKIIEPNMDDGILYRTVDLIKSGSIKNCKASIKKDASEEINDVYFMDYIISGQPIKAIPEFGRMNFKLSFETKDYLTVGLFRKDTKKHGPATSDMISFIDHSNFISLATVPDIYRNVDLTLRPGKYYFKAISGRLAWQGEFVVKPNMNKIQLLGR